MTHIRTKLSPAWKNKKPKKQKKKLKQFYLPPHATNKQQWTLIFYLKHTGISNFADYILLFNNTIGSLLSPQQLQPNHQTRFQPQRSKQHPGA